MNDQDLTCGVGSHGNSTDERRIPGMERLVTKEEYMKKAHSMARHVMAKNMEDYDYKYQRNIAQCMALHCLWLLGGGRDADGVVITEQWLEDQWLELCKADRPASPK